MSYKPKSKAASMPNESVGERNARLLLQPSVNSAAVIQSFAGKTAGGEIDINFLINCLRDTFAKTNDGDLSTMEAMLVGQATALQTIFTSLAKRAHEQTSQRNLESFLGLALKAQSQSPATIATLVELKYPRQVAFVKQTNVSHGLQQVNNRLNPGGGSRTEEIQSQREKLLVGQTDGGTTMDSRTTTAASGSHPTLQTLDALSRPNKRGRQG